MTSYFIEYDVIFVWIWCHFCLNMMSFLSEYDVFFVWIWRHFCLDMTSLLSEYDVIFVWIWCHICLNMTSLLSEYDLIFIRKDWAKHLTMRFPCFFVCDQYVFLWVLFTRQSDRNAFDNYIQTDDHFDSRAFGGLSAFLIKTLAVGRNTNRYVLVSRCVLADS